MVDKQWRGYALRNNTICYLTWSLCVYHDDHLNFVFVTLFGVTGQLDTDTQTDKQPNKHTNKRIKRVEGKCPLTTTTVTIKATQPNRFVPFRSLLLKTITHIQYLYVLSMIPRHSLCPASTQLTTIRPHPICSWVMTNGRQWTPMDANGCQWTMLGQLLCVTHTHTHSLSLCVSPSSHLLEAKQNKHRNLLIILLIIGTNEHMMQLSAASPVFMERACQLARQNVCLLLLCVCVL